jgi:hypothetical protein
VDLARMIAAVSCVLMRLLPDAAADGLRAALYKQGLV